MLSIKRLLYSLKRRFGTEIDFYQEVDTESNVLTGKRNTVRTKYSIPNGVFLDQNLLSTNPLNKILGQLTGMMDTSKVTVLFDAFDFEVPYIPTLSDYVIIHHQRYEISEINQVDNDQSYVLKLSEFAGSQLFEQFDILIKDKLTLVQPMQVVHNYTYIESIDQELDVVDILNVNIVSNQSVENTLEFNEAIQSD